MLRHGLSGPIHINGQLFPQVTPLPMPPMGLDDQQMADVLSYLRSHFSHTAGPVTVETIQQIRARTPDRSTPWTEAELAP